MVMTTKELRKEIKKTKDYIYKWVNCAWDHNGVAHDGIYLRITKKQALEIIESSEFVEAYVEDGLIHIPG